MTESQPKAQRATVPASSPYRPVIFVFVVFAAVLTVVGVSKLMTPKDLIPWRTDFAAAQVEARAASKPMFAYFTATWCGPCQEMRRTTWSSPEVAALMGDYIPVKIDMDEHPDLAQRYGVAAIPAYIQMNAEGRPVGPLRDGALTPGELIAWLTPNGRK